MTHTYTLSLYMSKGKGVVDGARSVFTKQIGGLGGGVGGVTRQTTNSAPNAKKKGDRSKTKSDWVSKMSGCQRWNVCECLRETHTERREREEREKRERREREERERKEREREESERE